MNSNRLIRIVRFNWAYVLVFVVVGTLCGGLATTLMPREYTANADVFVSVAGSTSTADLAQGSNFSQQQARNLSAVATREIVLSPVIGGLSLKLSENDLRNRVSTSVPLNTSMISIDVADADPVVAADIANAVASQLAKVVPTLTPQIDGQSAISLRVVERATPPTTPSSPNLTLLLILGFLGGFVLAALFVLTRELMGARVRSKEQVTELGDVSIIGSIAYDRGADSDPIVLSSRPHSLRAEEYRQLRSNLRFLQAGQAQRIFTFTSSIPGEGKSTTAANTAAALAASGQSVCLVEADLRRPSLAGILDLPPGLGVTSVLSGEVDLDDALLDWGPDDMKVLLAGSIPPNPAELLESAAMQDLLHRIRHRFDVTIIDSPPLNPVADATVVARMSGGVILVIGFGRVHVRELRRAIERLSGVGARVEGAVFNMAPSSSVSRYRYSTYSDKPDAVAAEKPPSAPTPSARSAEKPNRADRSPHNDEPGPRRRRTAHTDVASAVGVARRPGSDDVRA